MASVALLADGQGVATTSGRPYELTVAVPLGISTLTLGARATDFGGNVGTAADVLVTVTPDPRTTAIGRVVDPDGNPVAAATVKGSFGLSTTTLGDGTFSLPGLPTSQGSIALTAAAAVGRDILAGRSATVPVVPGGLTDMGTITLGGPAVSITAPAAGATVVEGSTIQVSAQVSDAVAIQSIQLLVNGQTIGVSAISFYSDSFTVPIGATALTISARATDANGAVGNASDVIVNVIPDPGTTAVGMVIDAQGNPIEGAGVTIHTNIPIVLFQPRLKVGAPPPPAANTGPAGVTGPDGRFSIPGVPTVQGWIDAEISATLSGALFTGTSSAAEPVPGGVADLGTTVLQQLLGCVTGNLHYFVSGCNPNDRGPVRDPVKLMDSFGNVATLTPDPLSQNPMRGGSRRKRRKVDFEQERNREITQEEWDGLLAAAQKSSDPRVYPLLICGRASGAREGELMKMEWRRLELHPEVYDPATGETRPGVPRCLVAFNKNGDEKMLYFPGESGEILREMARHRGMSPYVYDVAAPYVAAQEVAPTPYGYPGGCEVCFAVFADRKLTAIPDHHPVPEFPRGPFRYANKRAGIVDLRFHDLRSAWAQNLLDRGRVSDTDAMILGGWKSVAMVRRYAKRAHRKGLDRIVR